MDSESPREPYWHRKNYWEEDTTPQELSLVPFRQPSGRPNDGKENVRSPTEGQPLGLSDPERGHGDDDSRAKGRQRIEEVRSPRSLPRRATFESVSSSDNDDDNAHRSKGRSVSPPSMQYMERDLEEGRAPSQRSSGSPPIYDDGGSNIRKRERARSRDTYRPEDLIARLAGSDPRKFSRNQASPPLSISSPRLIEYGSGPTYSPSYGAGPASTSDDKGYRGGNSYTDRERIYIRRSTTPGIRSSSSSPSRRSSPGRRVSFGPNSRRSHSGYSSSSDSYMSGGYLRSGRSQESTGSRSRSRSRNRSHSRPSYDTDSDSDDSDQPDYGEYRRKSSRFANPVYARPTNATSRTRLSSRSRAREDNTKDFDDYHGGGIITNLLIPNDDLEKGPDVVVDLGETAAFQPTALQSRPTAEVVKRDSQLGVRYNMSTTKANIINATRYWDGTSNLPIAFQYYESATANAERQFRWIHCTSLEKNLEAIKLFVNNRAELNDAEKVLCRQVFQHVEDFVRKSSTSNCRLPPLSRCYRGISSGEATTETPWVIFLNMPYLRRIVDTSKVGADSENEAAHANSLMHYRYGLKGRHDGLFQEEADFCYLCEHDELEVPMSWAILTSSNVLITIGDEEFDAMHKPSSNATKLSHDQVREHSRKVLLTDKELFISQVIPLQTCETYFALFRNATEFFENNRNGRKGTFFLEDEIGRRIDVEDWENFRKQSQREITVNIIAEVVQPEPTSEPYYSYGFEQRDGGSVPRKDAQFQSLSSALVSRTISRSRSRSRPSPSSINQIIHNAKALSSEPNLGGPRSRSPSGERRVEGVVRITSTEPTERAKASALPDREQRYIPTTQVSSSDPSSGERRFTLPARERRYMPPTFTPSQSTEPFQQNSVTETDSTLKQDSDILGEKPVASKSSSENLLKIPPFFLWPTDSASVQQTTLAKLDEDKDDDAAPDTPEKSSKVRFQGRSERKKPSPNDKNGSRSENSTKLNISKQQREHLDLVMRDVEDHVRVTGLKRCGRERASFLRFYERIQEKSVKIAEGADEVNEWLAKYPPLKAELRTSECTWQRTLSTVLDTWKQVCGSLYPEEYQHSAFETSIKLRTSFLKSISSLCENYYIWYTKSNRALFNVGTVRGPWHIKDMSAMLDSRLPPPAELLLNIEDCQICSPNGNPPKYSSKEMAIEHLRYFHMSGVQFVDSDLSQYVVPDEFVQDVEAGAVALKIITVMLERLLVIKQLVQRIQQGVVANGQFMASIYHQPQSLIIAFEEVLHLGYYCGFVAQHAQENHYSMLPGSYVTSELLEMDWITGLEDCGNEVLFAFESVAEDLMAMAYSTTFSSGLTHEPVGHGYFLCLLLHNLCSKTRDTGANRPSDAVAFDVVLDYEDKVRELDLKAKKRPQRKYRREMTPLKDEISIIIEILKAQINVATEVQDLLKPSRWKQRQRSDWQLECQALKEFRREAQLQLADCLKMNKDLERMERQLAQDLDVEDGDHGKAILIFTITTVIFMPLSFVTSYFGMNTGDIRSMSTNQWIFWAVALPLTIVTVTAVMIIGYHGEHLRDTWSRFQRNFTRPRRRGRRQLYRQQRQKPQLSRSHNNRNNKHNSNRRSNSQTRSAARSSSRHSRATTESVNSSSNTLRYASSPSLASVMSRHKDHHHHHHHHHHHTREKGDDTQQERKRDWLRRRVLSRYPEKTSRRDDGGIGGGDGGHDHDDIAGIA